MPITYGWRPTVPVNPVKNMKFACIMVNTPMALLKKWRGRLFPWFSKFTLWVIAPDGTKTELKSAAKEDHYVAHFTPNQNGVYNHRPQ